MRVIVRILRTQHSEMEAAAGRQTDFDSNSAPYQHLTANLTWTSARFPLRLNL
jgi:hypothetical protein